MGVGPKAPRPMAPPIGGGYTLERLVGGVTIPLPVPLGYVLPGWPPILGVLRRNLPRKLGVLLVISVPSFTDVSDFLGRLLVIVEF